MSGSLARFRAELLLIFTFCLSCPVFAQTVYRCPGPPVSYAESLTPEQARAKGCAAIGAVPADAPAAPRPSAQPPVRAPGTVDTNPAPAPRDPFDPKLGFTRPPVAPPESVETSYPAWVAERQRREAAQGRGPITREATGTYGNLLASYLDETEATLVQAFRYFGSERKARDLRDAAARRQGWHFLDQDLSTVPEHMHAFMRENGSSGPEAFQVALDAVIVRVSRDAIRGRHGTFANLTAVLLGTPAALLVVAAGLVAIRRVRRHQGSA